MRWKFTRRRAAFAATAIAWIPAIGSCSSATNGGVAATGGAAGSAGMSGGTSQAAAGTAPANGGTAGSAAGAAGASPDGGTGGSSGIGGSSAGVAGAVADAGSPVLRQCSIFADPDSPIEKLTDTGCVDPEDPTKPASYMIPYEVNSPLWSDSADKQRFMRIPDGTKIHVIDCAAENTTTCATDPFTGVDGHFNYPVGTVMMKVFSFEGTTVETRLLMKFDDATWTGYSYQWNQEQTEATVQPNARRTATFKVGASQRSQTWNYPSRGDCSTCHTDYSGVTLGTEIRQLNRPEGAQNQLDRLEKLGIFDVALSQPLLTPLLLPSGTAGSVQDRARSYLHANCAFCHRPDGDQVTPDFRFTDPFDFKKMGICNATPGRGDVGAAGGPAAARLLAPGHPENSVISLRMKSLDPGVRMPQLATVVEDLSAVAAIDAWITSITSCPN
jgi:uncharacterized repeat protein (TIGR03806 family)